MSADSAGVAFVPLFDAQPVALSSVVSASFFQSHFVIVVLSRISRSRSPSHHTAKLHERGFLSDTFSPLTFHNPDSPLPDAHDSQPLCLGSMSAAMPRPTSGE